MNQEKILVNLFIGSPLPDELAQREKDRFDESRKKFGDHCFRLRMTFAHFRPSRHLCRTITFFQRHYAF
jgi:hypothetical protein